MPLLGSLAAGSVKGFGAQANLGYFLGQSLRFRGSQYSYLSRTNTSAGNRRTWTWSGWVKRGSLTGNQALFTAETSTAGSGTYSLIRFVAGNLVYFDYTNGTSNHVSVCTGQFRDPSAWYHIVVAVDTTQATGSDRCKIYVNGVQQSTTNSATFTQNYQGQVNDALLHYIGTAQIGTSNQYFDGYMGDVYLIDGQALTPSDFGKTDPSTGSWIPKKYSGTYGTNGFYLDFKEPNPNSAYYSFDVDGTGDYISAPAAQYANYINGSGDFTIEWWVNYDALPSDGAWYSQDSGSAVVSPFNLFQQTNSWRLYATTANGSWNVFANTLLATTSLTTGRWYHIACVRNGTTLTLYVDGVSQGSQTIGTASLWEDTTHNLSLFNDWQSAGGAGGINGRISNYRIVKGTAVYTGNFTPPTELLEDITNTTLLMARSTSIEDLSGNITISGNGNLAVNNQVPPLANGPGKDISGNDNHWGLKDIVFGSENSAATTYDLMNDVPTLTSADKSNFATLNPLNSAAAATLSLSNLRATSSAAYQYGYSTIAIPEGTGKFIFEITFNTNTGNDNYNGGGLVIEGGSTGAYARIVNMGNAGVYGVRDYGSQFGQQYIQNGSGSGTITLPAGTNILFVVDRGANTLTFYKNGVLQTGTGSTVTIPSSGNLFPFTHGYSTNCDINFGQRPFAYTPPSGYKTLNTYNL